MSQSCGQYQRDGDAVHRHRLALDHLGERAVRARASSLGCHDVHVVTARDQAGGEALGEPGRAVDVGQEGVGADEDRERARTRAVGGSVVGRRGIGHGMGGLSVRRGARRRRVARAASTVPEGFAAPGIGTAPVRWKHAPTAGRRRPDAWVR